MLTSAAGGLIIVLAGCVRPIPQTYTETVVARTIGLLPSETLEFQSQAEPLEHPSTAPSLLDAGQVVRLSVLRSPQVQAALARVRIAQAEAEQARLLPNPIISMVLRFPESGGNPVIDAGIAADLLTVLRRPGAASAADARLRATSADALTAVLDVARHAQERFFTIQSLEATLAVLQARGDLLRRLHDLAESKLRIGESTKLDLITIRAQQVQLEADIADRNIELRNERLALAQLIGQPGSTAEWTVTPWDESEMPVPTESELLSIAMNRRPEIQQRQWQLAALGADQRLTSWEILHGAEVGIATERDGNWSAGPSVSIPVPLFDFGQTAKDRARAAVIEARHELVATCRGVIEEVRRAYATLEGTKQNLARVQRQLVPLQQHRLSQTEAQFCAGQIDITALLLAEQDLLATRAQVIELRRRVALARVQLERAVGGPLISTRNASAPKPTTQPE